MSVLQGDIKMQGEAKMSALGLRQQYETEIRPAWQKRENMTSVHGVPRVRSVVLNMGMGRALQDKSVMESAMKGLSQIAGQKPRLTVAKNSIAGFKIREGMPMGLKVTLRGNRMYEFLQRFIIVAMPRIRDFRGVSPRSFDGHGNFSMGIRESDIFPEVMNEEIMGSFGMDIAIVTSAETDAEARSLLESFGIPFRS